MRDLTADDFGVLLSLFAVLLLAFAADFQLSRKAAQKHRRGARTFVFVNVTGELATVIALLLTWVALWSPVAWAKIDDALVYIPGSIAIVCAVILTGESVQYRVAKILRDTRAAAAEGDDDADD